MDQGIAELAFGNQGGEWRRRDEGFTGVGVAVAFALDDEARQGFRDEVHPFADVIADQHQRRAVGTDAFGFGDLDGVFDDGQFGGNALAAAGLLPFVGNRLRFRR